MRRGGSIAALAVMAAVLTGCSAEPEAPEAPAAPAALGATSRTVAPPAPTLEQRAVSRVAAMSRSERAGQVLMTAGPVPQLRGLAEEVRRYHLAGLMVRGRSSAGTSAVQRALAPAVAAAPRGLPLITATDQEGGTVQVLSGRGFTPIPSAVVQSRRSISRLQRDATGWGRALARAGVRLDLAPVADVPCAATARDNPPIADLRRNYGADPASAGRHVAAVVRGMRAGGVRTTVKHFPGLGCVRQNTDTTAHVVDTVTTASSARLEAFRAGIGADPGFVMMSSAIYSKLDAGVPALFSRRIVTGLLRERLDFDGVVMSDDTGGAVALRRWTPAQRATRFVDAGGDLLLDIVPAHLPALHGALVARAKADRGFDAKLTAAATRVVAARLALAG